MDVSDVQTHHKIKNKERQRDHCLQTVHCLRCDENIVEFHNDFSENKRNTNNYNS